jgi:hypothetical protein
MFVERGHFMTPDKVVFWVAMAGYFLASYIDNIIRGIGS